jgi:hypothetical protein
VVVPEVTHKYLVPLLFTEMLLFTEVFLDGNNYNITIITLVLKNSVAA